MRGSPRDSGHAGLLRFLRFALLPVRRLAEEHFRGEGAAWLLAGNALHADFAPESAGSGLFGWILCGLGAATRLPDPGRRRRAADRRAGRAVCRPTAGASRRGVRVERVLVRRGAAVGVRTADGREITAGRAVLAGTIAPVLFRDLVGEEHLPPRFVDDLRSFQLDSSTVKVDWSLDGPIPWAADDARRAGTIHVADGVDDLTRTTAQITRRLLPDRPFLVMGQYSMTDPTRQPAGSETAWAYTHVPQTVGGDAGGTLTGRWDAAEAEAFAERMEAEVERRAPGFRALIRARHVFTPPGLEAANANLVGGAINQGTAQIHQQLVFRPTPGLGRAETPIARLYLASASAHPAVASTARPGRTRRERPCAGFPARSRGRASVCGSPSCSSRRPSALRAAR